MQALLDFFFRGRPQISLRCPPYAGATQNLDTTSIGGSNNLANNSSPSNHTYPYSYVAIGVEGAAPGTAYESYVYANSTVLNPFQGMMVQDVYGNYFFHASDYPQFSVVPNDPTAGGSPTVSLGDLGTLPSGITPPNPFPVQRYTSPALPSGATGGFWVLQLDRATLAERSSKTYGTFNNDTSAVSSEQARLMTDLNAAAVQNFVILTTVGVPMNHEATAQLYGHTVNALYAHMNDAVTPTYTMLTANDPNVPKTKAVVSSSLFSQQQETGIIRGVFQRDRHTNLYVPMQASQVTQTAQANSNFINYDINRIARAPPVAWPDTDTPGHIAAYQYLSGLLDTAWVHATCPGGPYCSDIRGEYTGGIGMLACGVVSLGLVRRRGRLLLALCVLLVLPAALVLNGCSSHPEVPAGTSSVTITATSSGGITHSQTLQLMVQQAFAMQADGLTSLFGVAAPVGRRRMVAADLR